MRTSQVVNHFRSLRPDLRIESEVVDADGRVEFTIRKRDALSAIPGDPCHCTIALGCRRETDAAEALILTNVAYLLERRGRGRWGVVKYLHNGENVVKNTDSGGFPVWNTAITLRPPSPQRRVGVQTMEQKARQPKKRRQTKAHIAKRAASLKANPASARVQRVGVSR